jgi:hypothetical protein
MPFGIDDALAIGGGLGSLASGLFGDDGSEEADRALDQAQEQFKQGSQAQETAARRNLALFDPQYQMAWRAQQYLAQLLGLPYITSDPVMSSLRHNADNYIGVRGDGSSFVTDTVPGYTGGKTPRPVGGTSGGNRSSGSALSRLLGLDDGDDGGRAPAAGGLNFDAPKGTKIGTVNGVDYYRRDEDSLMPYEWAGAKGFSQTPGYKFQMDQGVQALDRSASARGLMGSGRTAKELTRFGQGLANQEYNNWLNRIASFAGMAPQATSAVGGVYGNLGASGYNSANNLAGLAMERGATDATAAQGRTSSFNSGLGGLLSGLGQSDWVKGLF